MFENINKLEQELIHLKIEKETELRFTKKELEAKGKEINAKELLIAELKKELAEIRINAPLKLEEERKKRQSDNVHTILNPKQLTLFKMLSGSEKTYPEILETAHNNKLDIHDMSAMRVQVSRLNKKLQRETNYKIEKLQRNDIFYYRIG